MEDSFKWRLEQLKSRLAAEVVASPPPPNANGVTSSKNQTSPSGALAAATHGPTNVCSSHSTSATSLVTSFGSGPSRHAAPPPLANFPPSFNSPYNAVVKYRDSAKDPLCAVFTTRHAVALLQAALHLPKRKRTREESEASTGKSPINGVNDANEAERDEMHESENNNNSNNKMDPDSPRAVQGMVDGNGEANLPTTDSSLCAVVSHFLPELETTLRRLTDATKKGKNEKVLGTSLGSQDENHEEVSSRSQTPYQTHHLNESQRAVIEAACGEENGVVVSGHPRAPCRSVNAYDPVARLAQGVYGVVFSATEASRGANGPHTKFALKHVKKQWLAESQVGFPPYLLREFDLLLRVRHPNVVRAREVVLLDKKLEATRLQQKQRLCTPTGTGSDNVGPAETTHDPNTASCLQQLPGGEKSDTATTASVMHSGESNVHGSKSLPQGREDRHDPAALSRPRESDKVKDVYLVMEYCPHDLKSFMYLHNENGVYFHLSSRNRHPDARSSFLSRVKCVMQQLFSGLAFLHDHRILHRDIKTSNILVSQEGVVKLCDFGLGRLYREGQELTANVVTLMYRAPELHFGVRDYSHKMDVWSLGCIMAELFLKVPLFHAEEEVKHFAAICDIIGIPTEETFSGLYKMPDVVRIMRSIGRYNRSNNLQQVFQKSRHAGATTIPSSGLDLLHRIFRWNPAERLSAHDALRHPFFHESPFPCAAAELLRPMPTADAVRQETKGPSPKKPKHEGIGALTPPPNTQTVNPQPSKETQPTLHKDGTHSNDARRGEDGNEEERPNVSSAHPEASELNPGESAGEETTSVEAESERELRRELDALREAQSPNRHDEERRMANQAQLRANQHRDSGSSPEK